MRWFFTNMLPFFQKIVMVRKKGVQTNTRYAGTAIMLILEITPLLHAYRKGHPLCQALGAKPLPYLVFSSLGLGQFVWLLQLDTSREGVCIFFVIRESVSPGPKPQTNDWISKIFCLFSRHWESSIWNALC